MLQGRRTLTALVIVVLLAATALAMVLAYRAERDSARDADEARARQAALAVRQNLTILAAGLRGSSTLVDSDGQVDPERFHEFARGILRETPFSRLSFAEQVTPADRPAFERSLGGPITEIGDITPCRRATQSVIDRYGERYSEYLDRIDALRQSNQP